MKAERQQEVLSYVIGLGGWRTPIEVSPTIVAKDMGFTPEVARKALCNLHRRGALVRHGLIEGRQQHSYSAVVRCHQLSAT